MLIYSLISLLRHLTMTAAPVLLQADSRLAY
jgi:hypothetical protein